MPASRTPEENREGRNNERAKAMLLGMVDDLITETEFNIAEYNKLVGRTGMGILMNQIQHWRSQTKTLLMIRARLNPKTAYQVPPELTDAKTA